jgi:integrase
MSNLNVWTNQTRQMSFRVLQKTSSAGGPKGGKKKSDYGRKGLMAVYRPKRNGEQSKFYVCEFVYQGKRIQESTGCASKTAAGEWEKKRRLQLERAHAGLPSDAGPSRIKSVREIITPYLDAYSLNHRHSSFKYAQTKLANVERLLGFTLLSDLTEDRIREYIRGRQSENVSGRTINMELGELSRAIGYPWSQLWPRIRKLEERKDIGRALTTEEQDRVLEAASHVRSPVVRSIIPVLLLTGMRPGEAMSLMWGQIDLFGLTIKVGRAKTSSGTGRVIPINQELAGILSDHRCWFVETFRAPEDGHFVFPFGSPQPTHPDRQVTDISSGWDLIRANANITHRLHDLRHTFATQLAENGVSESTMLALMGHMSRAMLERYSHIRMDAKREAVAGVTLRGRTANSRVLPVNSPVPSTANQIQ